MSLETLKNIFENEISSLLLLYAHEKKLHPQPEGLNNTSTIITPHPIGNYPVEFRAWRDCLLALAQADIRLQQEGYLEKQKGNKYSDREDYLQHVLDKFLGNVDKFYADKDGKIEREIREFFTDKGNYNLAEIKDGIIAKLAELTSESKEVISRKKQSELMEAKAAQITNLTQQNHVKSWSGIDADGDPENNMDSFVKANGQEGICGIKVAEAFAQIKKAVKVSKENGQIPQPRIASEDKKGVTSVQTIAFDILEGARIKPDEMSESFFDPEKRDQAIAALKKHIESLEYPKSEEPKKLINHQADLVLRLLASSSIILSDFDPKENKNLPLALSLIKEAVSGLANEKLEENEEQFSQSCVVLPLAESKKDIDNAESFYKELFTDIIEKINACKTAEELMQLQEFLVSNEEFFLGVFSGPSDATKDAGYQSLSLIANLMNVASGGFANINEALAQKAQSLGIENEEELQGLNFGRFVIEYGKGTSHKRGANLLFPSATTFQGFNFPPFMIKALHRAITDQSPTKIEIPFDKKCIDAACQNHQTLIGVGAEGEKGIVANFNDIKDNGNFECLERRYSNNQGTRGKDGIPEWKNTRAIGGATASCAFGLLIACSFPDNFDEDKFDTKKVVNTPLGAQIIMQELLSIALIDFNRAELLEFDPEIIDKCRNYVKTTNKSLVEAEKDGRYPIDSILKIADSVLEQIENGQIKDAFECFKTQLPIAYNLCTILTELSKQENSKEKYTAQATVLNALSNFQPPTIVANKNSKEKTPGTKPISPQMVERVQQSLGLSQ